MLSACAGGTVTETVTSTQTLTTTSTSIREELSTSEIVEKVSPTVAYIETYYSIGTGMIIDDLFKIKRGGGLYFKDYGKGDIPLVSAKNRNNGIIGLVDEDEFYTAPMITVERVTGKAFVQIINFNAVPDDVYVLEPKRIFDYTNLLEIATQINNERWRFSYARKVTPDSYPRSD